MGRGSTMYCLTCKVEAYVGYGSYMTWLDGCSSVAAFDERVKNDEELGNHCKNQNVRRFLSEHDGHNVGAYSEDWTYQRDGRTYMMGPYGSDTTDVITGNSEDGWKSENWDER